MQRPLLALAGVLLLGSGCAKQFYCEETPDDDGIRYCYTTAGECGSRGKDPIFDKPRAVTCTKQRSAFCRQDPNEDRVCASSHAECQSSIPRGLTDTHTGQPLPCDWVR